MAGLALDNSNYGLDDAGVGLDDQFAADVYFSALSETSFSVSAASHVAGTAKMVVTVDGASQPSNATFDASPLSVSAVATGYFTLTNTGGTAGAVFKAWVQINNSGTRSTQSIVGTYSNTNYIVTIGSTRLNASSAELIANLSVSAGLHLNVAGAKPPIVLGNLTATLSNETNVRVKISPAELPATMGEINATLAISDNINVVFGAALVFVASTRKLLTAVEINTVPSVNLKAGRIGMLMGGLRARVETASNIAVRLAPPTFFSSALRVRADLEASDNIVLQIRDSRISTSAAKFLLTFSAIFPTISLNKITVEEV